MDTLQVLIVDDHPLFRKGMRALLESIPDCSVIGEADTSDAAIELAIQLQPDLILMDLQMPGGSGLDATREIIRMSPHIQILVVTLFEDNDSIFAALRAGARGYILKDTDEKEMIRAIQAVGNSEAIFSPSIANHLMDFFSSSSRTIPQDVFPDLTSREREILELIAVGESNQSIAEILVISLKTVRNHVSNIYSKLQVVDRAQAVIKARESGLGKRH